MKASRERLVSQLQNEGLAVSSFSLVSEGAYAVADADWNYKDIPHLRHMHELVEAVPVLVDREEYASVVLQKVFGIRLPLSVTTYEATPHSLLYYMTWFFFILIVESAYESIGSNRTKVTTTYSIGSPKLLRWAFPLIRWVLTRNYAILMAADIQMRERKGQLRAWGYSFHTDGRNYAFEETLDIMQSNVCLPAMNRAFPDVRIAIEDELPEGGERLVGQDDHLGLRLVRSDNKVMVFPRMCPHEGASLDRNKCVNRRVQCAWHGRQISPLVTIDLLNAARDTSTDYHAFELKNGVLRVRLKS